MLTVYTAKFESLNIIEREIAINAIQDSCREWEYENLTRVGHTSEKDMDINPYFTVEYTGRIPLEFLNSSEQFPAFTSWEWLRNEGNVLPEGYSIEAPTFIHNYKIANGTRLDNVVNPVTHYIIVGPDGKNIYGTSKSAWGWETWQGCCNDAIESAWGDYNGAIVAMRDADLPDNFKTIGVYLPTGGYGNREYHPECLKHEVPNILDLEKITIWNEGYHVVNLMCYHCSEPICSYEDADKYRLNNEGYADSDEQAHQWALEDNEAPHGGEYLKSCELCREAAQEADSEEEDIYGEVTVEQETYNANDD
jgi:hypothetical protein